ncbi:hypothetical protein ACNVED_08320 [Legionella sp. D16C41]|uniref:hypothetical protein n=1 Tax=Legionella sp. D16C41 TaxID=3402688 RepID=UPI003AF44550
MAYQRFFHNFEKINNKNSLNDEELKELFAQFKNNNHQDLLSKVEEFKKEANLNHKPIGFLVLNN